MTKLTAQKHKQAIQSFLDNPDQGVWYKAKLTDPWAIIYIPAFYSHYYYTIVDEYSEFRKAIIDGKTIEVERCINLYKTEWVKLNVRDMLEYSPLEIRIKPPEPEYITGDWVENKTTGTIKQFHEGMLANNFELWAPEDGKLCIFYDNDTPNEFLIAKYKSVHSRESFGMREGDWHYTENYWDNIAPIEALSQLIKQ